MFARLLFGIMIAALAMPLNAQNWVVYDNFGGSNVGGFVINPTLWKSTGGICENALECERQIRDGELRLSIRGYGLTTTNDGENWAQNGLEVPQSEWGITGIAARLTLTRAVGNSCGPAQTNVGQMGLRAVFFNCRAEGPDDQAYDVEANLYMYPHPDQTVEVGGILRRYGTQDRIGDVALGSVNIGEQVTISVRWDRADQQVVYGLQRSGQQPMEGRISYAGLPDTASVWYPYKKLQLQTSPQNCTSHFVFSAMEAKIDRVMVSR